MNAAVQLVVHVPVDASTVTELLLVEVEREQYQSPLHQCWSQVYHRPRRLSLQFPIHREDTTVMVTEDT